MFNFFVRAWLLLLLSGFVLFTLQSTYLWLRDGRRNRRHRAAHFYAQLVVMDRVNRGEFQNKTTADLQEAYEFEKIAYLNN